MDKALEALTVLQAHVASQSQFQALSEALQSCVACSRADVDTARLVGTHPLGAVVLGEPSTFTLFYHVSDQ